MYTRREAIAAAIAVPFATGAESAVRLAGGAPQERSVPLFVADGRFVEAQSAARAAALRSGALTQLVMADVTDLYVTLDRALRKRPFAIAGLASSQALFVLEHLAWERGLRALYRGRHRVEGAGRVVHDLAGAEPIRERLQTMQASQWSSDLGAALAAWSPTRVTARDTLPFEPVWPGAGAQLTSWLFVPKRELAAI